MSTTLGLGLGLVNIYCDAPEDSALHSLFYAFYTERPSSYYYYYYYYNCFQNSPSCYV